MLISTLLPISVVFPGIIHRRCTPTFVLRMVFSCAIIVGSSIVDKREHATGNLNFFLSTFTLLTTRFCVTQNDGKEIDSQFFSIPEQNRHICFLTWQSDKLTLFTHVKISFQATIIVPFSSRLWISTINLLRQSYSNFNIQVDHQNKSLFGSILDITRIYAWNIWWR